jgi:hypothetical protein
MTSITGRCVMMRCALAIGYFSSTSFRHTQAEAWKPEYMPGPLLEESSFATLFPKVGATGVSPAHTSPICSHACLVMDSIEKSICGRCGRLLPGLWRKLGWRVSSTSSKVRSELPVCAVFDAQGLSVVWNGPQAR